MNVRDREFPDRRGARREVAPRSSRTAAALAPQFAPYAVNRIRPRWLQ
jgi:hypothetical protein